MDRTLDQQTLRLRLLKTTGKIILGLGILVFAFLGLRSLISPNIDLANFRVASVELGEISTTVTASGVIRPRFEEVIASPINSRIKHVYANLGARVSTGMPILELDETQIELAISNLQDQIELKDVEERVLAQQHREDVGTLASRKELLGIDLESQQLLEQRYSALYEKGAVSQFDLNQREISVRKTKIELRQIDDNLQDLQVSAANQLERVSLEKKILQQQLSEQQRLRGESTVRATSNGVITSLLDQLGQSVSPGMELVRIADLSNYHVVGSISDFYRRQFYEGLPVRVSVGEQVLQGRLAKILPTVENNGVISIWIDLENPGEAQLQPNMRAGLEIVTQQVSNGLRLTNGVAFNGSGRQDVFTIDGDTITRRAVLLGMVNNQFVEILDGLALGDEVIISDMSSYMHLDQVAIR